jgi:hypothetical protein
MGPVVRGVEADFSDADVNGSDSKTVTTTVFDTPANIAITR